MFDTDDIYNEAVKHSSVHNEMHSEKEKGSIGFKIVLMVIILALGYFAFDFYSKSMVDESLIVSEEPLVEVENNSEEEYIIMLASMESELIEVEQSSMDINAHNTLTDAMNDLVTTNELSDSSYISKLEKEIASEESRMNKEIKKERTIIVKKGDTLRSLSNKYYGNSQDYKRIIASNAALAKNNTIYEGQKIILPY